MEPLDDASMLYGQDSDLDDPIRGRLQPGGFQVHHRTAFQRCCQRSLKAWARVHRRAIITIAAGLGIGRGSAHS